MIEKSSLLSALQDLIRERKRLFVSSVHHRTFASVFSNTSGEWPEWLWTRSLAFVALAVCWFEEFVLATPKDRVAPYVLEESQLRGSGAEKHRCSRVLPSSNKSDGFSGT